jgi:hypothetical protein
MSQSLEVNIKTTSDVPAAMDKAKSATVSFSKQVEDIKKKFSTAFKDIFLGFTAPMILLQGAMSAISAAIEKAKQDAKEGLDLIAQGETRFATSEESRAAAFFKRKKELEEEQRLVEAGRTNITKQILDNEGGMFSDFKLPDQFLRQLREGSATLSSLAQNKEVQRIAMEYFTKTDEGKKISESLGPSADPTKSTPFKAPEGFGNVIGVGANPVMEAMNAQLEEQQKQTALLERIAGGSSGTDGWINNSTPSRAAMLKPL